VALVFSMGILRRRRQGATGSLLSQRFPTPPWEADLREMPANVGFLTYNFAANDLLQKCNVPKTCCRSAQDPAVLTQPTAT
jgi:hypothetical protein